MNSCNTMFGPNMLCASVVLSKKQHHASAMFGYEVTCRNII